MDKGTALGRVRGLGAARHGTLHWWRQRLTAGGNLVLMLWFFASMARLPAHDYASLITWLGSAWVALPMMLLVINVAYHFRLGLQIVIDDYNHGSTRGALTILANFFVVAVAATALFSILKIAILSSAAGALS